MDLFKQYLQYSLPNNGGNAVVVFLIYNWYMKYDFTIQAEKQKKLDAYIKENANILSEQQYWEDRIIALMVELGEVSNEIRFFKFWSKKPASEKDIIIDELVDCLHFAFSLGNTIENESWVFITDDMKRPINYIYFDIVEKLHQLVTDQSQQLFRSMLFNIVEIAWYLGYSMEDIEIAYDKKNAINYERQDNNY